MKKKNYLGCCNVKYYSSECAKDFHHQSIAEMIKTAKANKYMKDTLHERIIIDTVTGTNYTLSELDKMINN